jgi:sporulation protein YlmC with PRC-barrel domain
LSDLLHSEVYDQDGVSVGHVHDVRLVRDGPVIGSFGATFSIDGLIVGKGSFGSRLGFDRAAMKGPWVLKALFNRLHASSRFVPWDFVAAVEERKILISRAAKELHEPKALDLNGREEA